MSSDSARLRKLIEATHFRICRGDHRSVVIQSGIHEGWSQEMAAWVYTNVKAKGPDLEFVRTPAGPSDKQFSDGLSWIDKQRRQGQICTALAVVCYTLMFVATADKNFNGAGLELLLGRIFEAIAVYKFANAKGLNAIPWVIIDIFCISPIAWIGVAVATPKDPSAG
jgi:hypothetical protein